MCCLLAKGSLSLSKYTKNNRQASQVNILNDKKRKHHVPNQRIYLKKLTHHVITVQALMIRDHEIDIRDWPPKSQDLSPIHCLDFCGTSHQTDVKSGKTPNIFGTL